MERRRWFVLVGMAVALQAGAVAWTAPARREAVRAVLQARDRIRMTTADWQRLGDDVDVYLIEAASDPKLIYGARQRALGGLAAVRGERAKEFLHRFAASADAPAPLLASAIQAYARGFGQEDAAEVQRLASSLLEHPDWMVRRGAVRALADVGNDEALSMVRRHESRESHAAVQAAVREALSKPSRGPQVR